MASITKTTVKQSMERKRQNYLSKAKSQKEIMFGTDKEVFDFIVRHYHNQYNAWHGNYPTLKEVSYYDYYDLLVRKSDFEDMMDSLKEDWDNGKNPETKALMTLAKKIHIRYGRK